MQITTCYYNLLLNESLPDFEIVSDSRGAHPNFDYSHLEGMFIEPQKLSFMDQLEFRDGQMQREGLLLKKDSQVFVLPGDSWYNDFFQ